MADIAAVYRADARLATLLARIAATDQVLRIETDGEFYELRVHREGEPLRREEDYDPERACKAFEDSFGALPDLDAEAFIAEMKANRE